MPHITLHMIEYLLFIELG